MNLNFLYNIHQSWSDKKDREFIELLEENGKAKIIDLGCGNGDFTLQVKQKIGSEDIYGADVWNDDLMITKQRGIEVHEMDFNKKFDLPDKIFDVVVSNQVIEHLWYPIQFLENIHRILKNDGYAVVSTENLSSWDNVISLMIGFTPFSLEFDKYRKLGNPASPHNDETGTPYPPHTRVFTLKGLIHAFERTGFVVEKIKGSGYLPFNSISSIDPNHSRFITCKIKKRST
jgi:SAM-dependent methyltransferase